MNFYNKHLYYPDYEERHGIEGTVYVMFIVEKDGQLTNIKATNHITNQLDKIAVKLIKKMPKWNPGKKEGEKVRVLHILPVTFQME